MKNKTTIMLLEDLSDMMFRFLYLRYAKKTGDTEIVNHYQLGQLYYQKIKFKKL